MFLSQIITFIWDKLFLFYLNDKYILFIVKNIIILNI